MYYYTFKIKRNENYDDIIMFTSPQVPENVIDKSHPNRDFIAKMLVEKEFINYSVDQISNAELLICRSENQVVEL